MPRANRLVALIALGALLIAAPVALPGGEDTAAASSSVGGRASSVSQGLDLTANTVSGSPTPDPVDAFGGRAELKQRSTALQSRGSLAPADEFTALCSFGGTSGKRIEVIYGVPQDRPNRYAEIAAPLTDLIRQVNNNLEAADAATSQNYRFLCSNGVDVTIRNVTLLPVGVDGVFTFDDYVLSLKNQISAGLGQVNFSAANRIYIAYVDQIQDVYPYGGQGDLTNDDQPDPATNANNDSRSRYSMSAYLDMPVIAHEVGHNLGAVQDSAPHSSRAGHCYDEADLMCYNDGGSYFRLGGMLTYTCSGEDWSIDCNDEDYYFPGTPPPRSYLATHWNIANSGFLTPVVPTPSGTGVRIPAMPAQVSAIAGDARVFVSWAPPAVSTPAVASYQAAVSAGGRVVASMAVDGALRTATIKGLTNNTVYTVTVAAVNGGGMSTAAGPDNTVTPRAAAIREIFSSSAANFTEILGGTWSVSSGRYSLAAPSTASLPNANLAIHQTLLTGDFSIMATAAATATSSKWNDFSIIFGYQKATNYYFANFSEGQDSASNGLFRVSDGRSRQITAFSATIAAGTYQSIRIERQGPLIRVFRGNALVASAIDSTFTSGRVGFGSKNDAAKFDDLIVTGTPMAAPGGADTTAPTITSRSPASGGTGLSRSSNVAVTFSEGVLGLSTSTFTLINTNTGTRVPAAVSRTGTTNTYVLNPIGTLAAKTSFTVSVIGSAKAVRDRAGNPVATSSYRFTTGS